MNTRSSSNSNSNNIFSNNNYSSSNNIFMNNNNSSRSSGNIFNNSNNNTSGSNNNNNSSGNNIFNGNNNSTGNNIFNNNSNNNNQSSSNNIFNNNNQGGNNIFNNNNQGGNNIFSNNNNNQNKGNNIFNNNSSNTSNNLFNNNNNSNNNSNNNNSNNNLFSFNNNNNNSNQFNNNNNQQTNTYISSNYFSNKTANDAQAMHILANTNISQLTPQQQLKIFQLFSKDYIISTLNECKKHLDVKELEQLSLHRENILKDQKISKIASEFNGLKDYLIIMRKELKNKILDPIKQLKKRQAQIQSISENFTQKTLAKLHSYKVNLMQSISQTKMLDCIKKQIDQLEDQIKQFINPISKAFQRNNSSQSNQLNGQRQNYSFNDPNEFCMKISKRILANMIKLDQKMDELLACEIQSPEDNETEQINQAQIIQNLIEYYQRVALSMKEFSERYNKIREKALKKGYFSKKISQKAASKVAKQFEAYELVKEIQGILDSREKLLKKNRYF